MHTEKCLLFPCITQKNFPAIKVFRKTSTIIRNNCLVVVFSPYETNYLNPCQIRYCKNRSKERLHVRLFLNISSTLVYHRHKHWTNLLFFSFSSLRSSQIFTRGMRWISQCPCQALNSVIPILQVKKQAQRNEEFCQRDWNISMCFTHTATFMSWLSWSKCN